MNTITRNFGSSNVCRIFAGCDRGVRSREFTAFCFQWIRLALLTDIYWKGSCRGLSSLTKTELSFPKSAQTIQTMQKNNRLLGILKIESANVHFHANPYISPNAQRERICIFTEVLEVPRSTDPQFSHTR